MKFIRVRHGEPEGTDLGKRFLGIADVPLTDKGVEMVYIEPENDIKVGGKPYHHDYTEKCRKFFPRRDL